MAASCSFNTFRPILKLIRFHGNFVLNIKNICYRPFITSSIARVREIHRQETENQITIEGVKVKSERAGNVINIKGRGSCPLCKVGIRDLKHTDILILSQFVNSDGTVIPQHISGICSTQQFRVVRAVVLAQRAGLIPKKPGTPLFGDWEKYNTYFKRF